MRTLHVHGVSEDLFAGIQQLAQNNGCSLSTQVIAMLYEALGTEESYRAQGQTLSAIECANIFVEIFPPLWPLVGRQPGRSG